METKKVYTKRCPRETANPISILFYGWLKELFWKGSRKDLLLEDLYFPLRSDESERLGNRLEIAWNQELLYKEEQEKKKSKTSKERTNDGEISFLARALVKTFWYEYFLVGLWTFMQYCVFFIIEPILQAYVISYFNIDKDARTIGKSDALIYAGGISLILLLSVMSKHLSEGSILQIGMRARVACSSLVYRKILRLSKGALTRTTPGQVINLLSNDVSRFDDVSALLHFVWITPIQLIIVTVIIWRSVKVSAFIGIACLLSMTLPVHSIFVHLCTNLRKAIATLTDKRVQMMNELVSGIEVIKMYAWEKPFLKIVAGIRIGEMKKVRFVSFVRATYLAFIVFTSRTVLFYTLISFALMGNYLKPDVTYMLATYYETLQLTTAHFFPQALIFAGETMVSIRRLEEFLLLEEHENAACLTARAHRGNLFKSNKRKKSKEPVEIIRMTNDNQTKISKEVGRNVSPSIILKRATASWIPEQLPPTLCHVSFKIQSGNLCALIGQVGSGKSSLLHLLLKELPLGAGKLRIASDAVENSQQSKQGFVVDYPNLKISYASQEAWLFSGSVKENILFGEPFDKERYIAVTKACALTTDFQQLPYGDQTNVGESGSSLSGGQKARVNLARAVYKQADIYLLDDPLSAVDTRVAKHLFDKCIKKYLNGKTRILVTHQLQFVKQADVIVVLDRGCVKMQGSYEELSRSRNDFTKMISDVQMSVESRKQSELLDSSGNKLIAEKRPSSTNFLGRASITSNTSSLVSYNYDDNESAPDTENEVTGTGRISTKLYGKYLHQGGSYFTLIGLLLAIIISQAVTSGNDYWVSYWTNLEVVRRAVANSSSTIRSQYKYMFNNTILSSIFTLDSHGLLTTYDAIYIYTFFIILCTVTVIGRNIFFVEICTNASRNLHDSMFSNVLRTRMSFFHRNASGRILNRFAKDVGTMDEVLPRVMLETIQIFLVILGVLVVVVMINYWMFIPLIIMLGLFYFIRLLYLSTAQNVKRLEGVAKSPVFSHINTTLYGLTTIRTRGSDITTMLCKNFDYLQDVHTGAWYMTIVTPQAFGLYVDIVACLFVTCLCFSFLLFDSGDTLGGNVGLAISQAMIIIGTLQHGIKQSNEVVTQITSVERILQYTKLPTEGSWDSDNPPPPSWPSQGRVSLKNVTLRYAKNEAPVLMNLNATIEGGWKVGIVGRTGAGKSSLISVLFRLFTEELEGEINVDGVDTSSLGLHELRSRLSIIPQQPFLFSESLRYNLDPFGTYNDAQLWETLQHVELSDLHLDQEVTSSGSNLSIGQRQLLCLARAILRNNRILVLDEATANIDSQTDNLIQRTIRTRFADCTVITIAHRLHTIIDSDKIIVMDAGRIVEFGCPHELLRDRPQGTFSQMVNNTGVTMAQTLREQAEKACTKNTMQRSLSRRSSIETDTTDVIQSEL